MKARLPKPSQLILVIGALAAAATVVSGVLPRLAILGGTRAIGHRGSAGAFDAYRL